MTKHRHCTTLTRRCPLSSHGWLRVHGHFPVFVYPIAHREQIVNWTGRFIMGKEAKLQPKGVYCCPRCDRKVEVFIKVREVACNQHGQMVKAGK
jgi:hypothetical protein